MTRKRSIQQEGRIFQNRWKLDYFCTEINNEIICLLCQKKIGAIKEYNISRHYNTKHYEEYNVFQGIVREEKLDKLISSFHSQLNFFSKLTVRDKSLTRASYEISYILGCRGKPFSDGELIKDCMVRAVELICPEARQKILNIPLSRNTVAERIGDISDNLTSQIRDLATKFMSFSLAVDESTDIRDVAQVSVFFRGCDIDMNITEELLDIIPLKGTTKGKDIFDAVMQLLDDQNFPLEKLVSVTTDGAKSMTGRVKGFVTLLNRALKDKFPAKKDISVFHCLIHQQVLCLNVLKMSSVLKTVTKIVNIIRSRGLNHRKFVSILQQTNAEFQDLPYYTEVRWLSCHKVLKVFNELIEEIGAFLESKVETSSFATIIGDTLWKQDLAFLTDLTSHMNSLNINLQGRNKCITNMYDEISGFRTKLSLFKSHLEDNIFVHFPCCSKLKERYPDLVFATHIQILDDVKCEFDRRFKDFENYQTEFKFFMGPFSFDVAKAPLNLQLELIDLQSDSALKEKYNEVGVPAIYSHLNDRYEKIKELAAKISCMFGSTYLCEQLFSCMKLNKNMFRSRLTDKNLSSIMKISCTQKLTPNFDNLIDDKTRHKSSNKDN